MAMLVTATLPEFLRRKRSWLMTIAHYFQGDLVNVKILGLIKETRRRKEVTFWFLRLRNIIPQIQIPKSIHLHHASYLIAYLMQEVLFLASVYPCVTHS
jgi:hypothetical protein